MSKTSVLMLKAYVIFHRMSTTNDVAHEMVAVLLNMISSWCFHKHGRWMGWQQPILIHGDRGCGGWDKSRGFVPLIELLIDKRRIEWRSMISVSQPPVWL